MRFLTIDDVLGLHEGILTGSGGTPGILNLGAVDSALYRCQWGPFFGNPLMEHRAALVLRGICQDHPFADGNKRTALLTADTFLRLNGTRLHVTETEATRFILAVAQDQVDIAGIAF